MELTGKLMEALGNLAFDKARKYYHLVDNLRSLETKLQRLRTRKTDFESQVKVAERSGTKKRKMEVENWLEEVATVENEFVALKTSIEQGCLLKNAISSGDRVAKMDATVEDLIEQSKHFDGLLLEVFESRGEPREITELFGEMFRKGLETITAWLDTSEILRIGIWGMGGVGKTTLAEQIHNHLLENTQFKVYWISVSQDFTVKRLQGDVAKRLGLDLSDVDDEKVRARRLRDAFKKMEEMVVLMLDDVWEDFCLDSLGIDARNCRLILTTRSLEVCNRMQCQSKFELKTLDTEEAWGLFERTLGSETVLDGDLTDIAKSVAKRCDGLPLGIVTVAGSMRGVNEMCEWRNALEDLKACSVGHDKMEKKVFRILEWSFNRLNKCERNCFLYCCLYPEDSDIKREELIDLFIGAELMSKRESRSKAVDQGQTILNKLIKVCLLEKTTDFIGVDCVKMHDLVRDMALRITHGNSKPAESSRDDVPRFLVKSMGKGNSKVTQNWTEDLHAVSFYPQYFEGVEIPPDWSPNCPKLSTLLLSHVIIKEIPDSFFRHMCGLKVLNLSWCAGITKLPNCVSDMVNLTALILRDCGGRDGLQSVPPLGKLKQLRDLDLSCTKIEDLPESWESLVNLERLNLEQCLTLRQKIIPKGTFSQLHRLQLLLLPPYGNVQVNDPEVLNQLEVFIGCLSFTDFYNITHWPKDYHVYINDTLTKGPCYDIDAYGCQEKHLYFHQCKLGRGSNNLPDDMESLIIQDCEGMGIRCLSDVFRNFINLSHLSELEIMDLVGIEFFWQLSSASPRDQLEVSSFSPLCGLEELRLTRLPNLVGLFYGESEPYLLPAGTFSCLRELWISGCDNMKQLFTVQLLQNLQNLETLQVKDCHGLEEIAADGNGGGEGIQLTSSGGGTTMISLPNLRCLSLDILPQLNNICKAAMICDSIEKIAIFGCPKVKRLPLFLPTINGPPSLPSTLRKIRGDKEWWESLEWGNPCAKNALDPYFTTRSGSHFFDEDHLFD